MSSGPHFPSAPEPDDDRFEISNLASEPRLQLEAAYHLVLDERYSDRHEPLLRSAHEHASKVLTESVQAALREIEGEKSVFCFHIDVGDLRLARHSSGVLRLCGLVQISDRDECNWLFTGRLCYPLVRGLVLMEVERDVGYGRDGQDLLRFTPLHSPPAFSEEAVECDGLTHQSEVDRHRYIAWHLISEVMRQTRESGLQPGAVPEFACTGDYDGVTMKYRVGEKNGTAWIGHDPKTAKLETHVDL